MRPYLLWFTGWNPQNSKHFLVSEKFLYSYFERPGKVLTKCLRLWKDPMSCSC